MRPVKDLGVLRKRVYRLLKGDATYSDPSQLDLHVSLPRFYSGRHSISESIGEFLQFLTLTLPDTEIYLFGGILRDLALFGKKGFNSDIDLVVDGDWLSCQKTLASLEATRNKFGGYRLWVEKWPVDIWNAQETWAIKEGLVEWKGVSSLLRTTVLNWDAILMNWRSGAWINDKRYLSALQNRYLDIVLEENPSPLGMTVRVFRHLCMKDAQKISTRAAAFLARSVETYTYSDLAQKEASSYGNVSIDENVYDFFSFLSGQKYSDILHAYSRTEKLITSGAVSLPIRQFTLPFEIETEARGVQSSYDCATDPPKTQ